MGALGLHNKKLVKRKAKGFKKIYVLFLFPGFIFQEHFPGLFFSIHFLDCHTFFGVLVVYLFIGWCEFGTKILWKIHVKKIFFVIHHFSCKTGIIQIL